MEKITPSISAIVLSKNEEPRIDKCLASLDWVDERIVVDNGSTDRTVEHAKKHKAMIVSDNSSDFSHLRNTGRDKSTSTWLMYVDADEYIPADLKDEILATIKSYQDGTSPVAYYVKRENYYLGKKWPVGDRMQRLFLKTSLRKWQGIIHETAYVDGTFGTLRYPLIHDTHRTLEEMIKKTNEWSEAEARLRFESHHPTISWWRLFRVMVTGFVDSYVRQGGWRAGTSGFIESIFQSYSMFITYAKLWEMQKDSSHFIQ